MSKKLFILAIGAIILIAGAFIAVSQFSRRGSEQDYNPLNASKQKDAAGTGELNKVFAALGSSLTKASNLSSDKQGENEAYSFSAGTKISSLYLFLKNQKSELTAINFASPGAEMKDVLERQLSQALSYDPMYITLDPAADVVTRNSVGDFKKNLSKIIKKINPRIKVFLFSYPNFIKMRTAPYQSCDENKVGVNLGNLTEKNILAFNQAMKEVVSGKQNVIFLDIYNLLGPEDVSDYDCLHININGQKKIAGGFIKILESAVYNK